MPQTFKHAANNRLFWESKFSTNKRRDLLVTKTLRDDGWRVLRIWEHELAGNGLTSIARIKALLGDC
jgi:DNA mismatch endonuclease (patch repair protein)